MTIRPYEPKDFEAVRSICLTTCHDSFLLSHKEVLWAKYADYYTLEEASHVFVAEGDDGVVKGYILCATDAKRYHRRWNEKYRKILKETPVWFRLFQRYTECQFLHMTRQGYSAHLHIDLDPSIQHKGIGTKLMNTLLEQLKEEGLDGVYLGCSLDNEPGNAFYRKCGFRFLRKIPACNLYGYRLKG